MSTSAGSGSFDKNIYTILLTDPPERIHLTFSQIICIGIIIFICVFFMIIKIKNQESTGIVCKKWTYSQQIRTIFL